MPPGVGVAEPGPEVTVVIPTRNRSAFLKRALACALGQEEVDLEVVVVDDGSTDDTAGVLYRMGDPRLRVVRNDVGAGVARARNRGMAVARGKWIAWLDDDDLWAPRKLRAALEVAATKRADFVWCSALVVDTDGRLVGFEPAGTAEGFEAGVLTRNPMPGGCSTAMARAEAVRTTGGFDEQLHVVADWDYWIRLLEHAPGAAVDEALAAYVVHSGNMVLRDRGDVWTEFERFAAKHEQLAGSAGFDRVAYADWVATGLRRGGRRMEAARLFLKAGVAERSLKGLGLAARVLLGDWAVELPRRRWRPRPPERPDWLEALG
jgi:glycosyltransferase involved in cell wall biosynthesis